MKAVTAISNNNSSGIISGRISRRQSEHGNAENAEIKMYLSKLKDLVPFMPKNRKLSKLEIIQNVIDYICDLQSELETNSAISSLEATRVLADGLEVQSTHEQNYNNVNSSTTNHRSNNYTSSSHQYHVRKPLVDRSSPNTILNHDEVNQQNLINHHFLHSHSMTD